MHRSKSKEEMFKNVFLLLWFLDQRRAGTSFEISSHFLDGDLVLTWPQISLYQDVSVKCNGEFRGVSRVYNPRFIVSNVLDCYVTDVIIRGTVEYRYIEKRKQFNLDVMIASEGESVIITFPSHQSHITKFMFRINNQSSLVHVTSAKHLQGSYILKLTKVTPSDAGYYGIGVNEEEASSNNGVVLVIKAAPSIPIISGKKTILRGETTTFTCNSVSRSRPHYYTKFPAIVYTWFVNASDMKHNTQRLELAIFTPTVVKCQAAEGLLSTSANVFIEPQYGPERVTMTPFFNQTVTLHEKDAFGPVTCTADCNPPCHFQWKIVTRDGEVNDVINNFYLPRQVLRARTVSAYRCLAISFHRNSHGAKSVSRDIHFNIQYGPDSVEMIPFFHQTVTLQDGDDFGPVTCKADCNPPCHFQWKEITRDKKIIKLINGSTLPLQVVHARVLRYSCVATGFHGNSHGTISVSSDISLNVQYGPDYVEMTPFYNQTVTLHSGDSFGPVTCTADCNPACHFQWKEVTSDGNINDVINASTLPRQVVHTKGVTMYRCVVTGFYGNSDGVKTVSREIYLNIQYLALPTITAEYNGQKTNDSVVHANEGEPLSMKCTGTGNPEPNVSITPIKNSGQRSSLEITPQPTWDLVIKKLQCEDTKQYTCKARSPGFNDTETDVAILVKCTPRLDESVKFRRDYQVHIDSNVIVLVPVIAYPMPQNIVWIGGPLVAPRYFTKGRITPKESLNMYQFLVIGDIPIFDESIFGNFTLFTDGWEIVTISIFNIVITEAEKAWNLSLIVNILLGSFASFCMSCLFYQGWKHKRNKDKDKNTASVRLLRPIEEQTETHFTVEQIAPNSNVDDCGYESLPIRTDFNIGFEDPIDNTYSIESAAETYIQDGRVYYKVKEERNSGEEDPEYRELAVYIDVIDEK